MHPIERWILSIRHAPSLAQSEWLWSPLRRMYDPLVRICARHGLERIINGTDRIRVLPEFRHVQESYEPDLWRHFATHIHPGDVVADVGAFIGLYSIAAAQKVRPAGRVVAFEPDPGNFTTLNSHIRLNAVEGLVDLVQAAVAAHNGAVAFETGRGCESQIRRDGSGMTKVPCVRLDSVFDGRRLDVLKIDVEGYEEKVLEGGIKVLADPGRGPRVIYIEAHPYAWPAIGTSSRSLIGLLASAGYEVWNLDGAPVKEITSWGHVAAIRRPGEMAGEFRKLETAGSGWA